MTALSRLSHYVMRIGRVGYCVECVQHNFHDTESCDLLQEYLESTELHFQSRSPRSFQKCVRELGHEFSFIKRALYRPCIGKRATFGRLGTVDRDGYFSFNGSECFHFYDKSMNPFLLVVSGQGLGFIVTGKEALLVASSFLASNFSWLEGRLCFFPNDFDRLFDQALVSTSFSTNPCIHFRPRGGFPQGSSISRSLRFSDGFEKVCDGFYQCCVSFALNEPSCHVLRGPFEWDRILSLSFRLSGQFGVRCAIGVFVGCSDDIAPVTTQTVNLPCVPVIVKPEVFLSALDLVSPSFYSVLVNCCRCDDIPHECIDVVDVVVDVCVALY